ncbi:MAG: hypothetical protein ACOZF0_17240 [Thermodesulfobacteriota bacterium]
MVHIRNRQVLFCLSAALVIFLIDLMIPLGVAGGVPYIVVILIAARYPDNRFVISMASLTSLLTILGYFWSPPGGEAWKVYANRSLAVFAVWTTAVLSLQKKTEEKAKERAVAEREKALNEIKILKGMLPICASCKKIRDDQGNWHALESYIHQNSEAMFSHGVCPDCIRTLYPGLAKKLNLPE